MTHTMNEKVKEYGHRHRLRGRWSKALAAMACLVVFCTTYALILPAITLDHDTVCGLQEHTHTAEACYAQELVCTDESTEHVHSDECYASVLTCELSEHQHTENCYPQETEEQTAESDTALTAETEETSEAQTEEASEKESEELVLTEQTVSAGVYTDKTYSTPSDESVTITLKGTLPENVQVKAYPVSVNLNDDSVKVIEAYDIGLFVTVTDETTGGTVEKEYEPKDSVQVKIVSDKLNDVKTVDVYHIGDAPNAEPEKVNSNVAVDKNSDENSVEFDANEFSAYVLATTAETDTETPSDEASDENADSDTAEEPTDSETVTEPEQNEDATADGNAANDANTVDEPTEADETDVTPQAGTYSVKVVYYDDTQSSVSETADAELKYGIIAKNLPTNVKEGYTYQGAYLTTDTTDYTGTPIAYVTVEKGKTYYSVDADGRAASELQEGEIIALHYVPTSSEVKINLTKNGEINVAGNEVKGLPSTYKTNSSFEFQVSAARGYTATVQVGNTSTTVDSGKTQTISVNTGSSDVTVDVTYTQKNTVTFDPNVFQNSSYRYLYDSGTARFTTQNNNDQTEALNTSTGASFTYTFTTKNQSTTWQVDSMKINGVYLAIPARTQGSSATTTIVPSQNGEPAMTATLKVTNVSNQSGRTAYTYQLTITGAYEDVKIDDANLNAVTWSEVIPSATEGVTFKNETSGGNGSSGLNQPVQTEESVKPTFVFGLENGYENLEMKLYAYNQSGQKQNYLSGVTNDKITLPTNTGASTTVKSGNTTIATITKDSDGTYKIVFESKTQNSQITLQLLKVSATKKEYKVEYDVGNGTGTITDNAAYDVVDRNKVVVTSEKPTPPDGQYFYGWKIEGDSSEKVYFTGDSIDISDDSIQAILNNQENTKTLKLVANYVTTLNNGNPIDVLVNIYLDGTRSKDKSYTVGGVVGKGLTLTDIKDTITVGDKIYKLDRHNSPLDSIELGDSFNLYYVSSVDLTIAKVDNSGKPLTGAEFYMYYKDDNSTRYYYSKNGWTDNENSKSTISPIGDKATATVSGLSIGKTYYLVETKAPAGYQLLTDEITITPKSSTELTVSGNGAEASNLTVKVTNQTGEALPTTGGPGTTLYTLSGLLLMAFATAGGLMYSGKLRKKGVTR